MTVETTIAAYGYPAVLIATFFEGEAALVIAGFLVHRGYMTLPGAMFGNTSCWWF
jgi:membrane protein DedA with SNARE-associated domain